MLADGFEDLAQENYNEIESDTDQFPFAVDWERALASERLGNYRAISCRQSREIAGYACFHIAPQFHSRFSVAAYNDVLYVRPEFRGRCGVALVRRAEDILRGLGVRRIFYTTKVHFPQTGALLAKMGYTHRENVYERILR